MRPALPLGDAGPYVAAAYIIFLLLILIYVSIMATRLGRLQRELAELTRRTEEADPAVETAPAGERAEVKGH